MNRTELARAVASRMRNNDIKKSIKMPSQKFIISDGNGNEKEFVVRSSNQDILYTVEDVETIIDTCINVIEDALKSGMNISVSGFGILELKLRKERNTFHPITGEAVKIEEHFAPKFTPGVNLRMCAKIFELSKKEQEMTPIITEGD